MASRALGQDLSVGLKLGHYRIVEKIGAGGMGEVYRARDEHLTRDVAIKVLPPGTLSDESARIRLGVARETLVGVEAGTEAVVRAVGHGLDFREPGLPILEKRSFVRCQTLQRTAGTRRATPHARVYRGGSGLTQSADTCGQGYSHDSAANRARNSPECHAITLVDPEIPILYTGCTGLGLGRRLITDSLAQLQPLRHRVVAELNCRI